VKVLALDYGSARTGVAVSDPSGLIARPLTVVERVGTKPGIERLLALIAEEEPEQIVVGLPLTLRGEHGKQARETEDFAERLRGSVTVPVELFDERMTTVLAARTPSDTPEDARAAAHLLESFLRWSSNREN
jgi:putative Holliday junction resolvase